MSLQAALQQLVSLQEEELLSETARSILQVLALRFEMEE